MFDFDKALAKIVAFFVALLLIMLCIWGAVEILNHIWIELLLLFALIGAMATIVALVWLRSRRW